MEQTPILLCQLCGKSLCGKQHGQENETNYQKLVDPPAAPYKQILPDHRYDEDEKRVQERKGKSKKADSKQICVSIPIVFGENKDNAKEESKKVEGSEAKEKEKEKEERKEEKKEEKKEKETEKEKSAASSATKASCLPMGGQNCPPPVKMMLCLPCPPPNLPGLTSGPTGGHGGGQPACKPKDYAYRCESRELRAGNLYSCCQCVKRNGLQHDCPRSPCQGRSACLAKPWPDCWPSGGCHGIDFTRERGTKRYNPCSAQRFDNKVCNPPGGGGGSSKSDCGGQMMVVVCPPPK